MFLEEKHFTLGKGGIPKEFPTTVERFIIKSETGECEGFLEEKHFTLGKGGIPKEFPPTVERFKIKENEHG